MQGLTKTHNWKNATIMAKASMTAYQDLGAFQKEFDPEAKLFDVDGTMVRLPVWHFVAQNQHSGQTSKQI